jgi:G3E family GTPase
MKIPAHVVAGPLGVGKTTTLLALFRHRPPTERWAVVVNEFGSVGIDGAVLSESGLAVKEIAGGCVCCVAGPALRSALVEILRKTRPDRLFVEPTGLAHPAAIVDLLRSPGLAEHVEVRGVIVLLDPRRLRPADPLFQDLVSAADVLVAHRADLSTDEELAAFQRFAGGLWPAPARTLVASHGELPADVLDAPAAEHSRVPPRHAMPVLHVLPVLDERGFVWPPERVFDADRLQEVFQELVRPGNPALPQGVERAKGIFHTHRGWRLVQASADRITTEPVGWRRDSRVELVTSGLADWSLAETRFSLAMRGDPALGGL